MPVNAERQLDVQSGVADAHHLAQTFHYGLPVRLDGIYAGIARANEQQQQQEQYDHIAADRCGQSLRPIDLFHHVPERVWQFRG